MRIIFFKRTICYRPTLWGWLLLLSACFLVVLLFLTQVVHFLSVNDKIPSKTLVIEGFVPGYALKSALDFYAENEYTHLIVTGQAITAHEYASLVDNTADATILALKELGFTDSIYAARVTKNIYINRTYHTAVATKMIFEDHPDWEQRLTVFSIGVHARRSRMMFRKALGSAFSVGIIAYPDRTFDPSRWWRSSKGFRNVSNELIATLYVSLFFHPDITEAKENLSKGKFIEMIDREREEKDIEFADSLSSPFTPEERAHFHGFHYFDPDPAFVIPASFKVDTTSAVFKMPTTTNRTPEYRIYGYLDFIIAGSNCRLTAYQNMAFIEHPEYGGLLFVPFTDETNGLQSYGAGRYIDIPIPNADTLMLDFNTAYNPYCAYAERWSCPLVPFENHLDLRITAGEKKYK